jgi:hypothetical protein
MTPAGVEGNVEIGIGGAGDGGGALGRLIEPGEIDRPTLDLAVEGEIKHLVRPLADGGRIEQAAKLFAAIAHWTQNLPRSRPTTERSCSSLGAPSGV